MKSRHIGPAGYQQARDPKTRRAELRRAKRAAARLVDCCLWDYVEGSREWYARATADIRAKYGPDADLFADILAATSPQADIHKNVAFARDAYDRHKRGLPVEGWLPNHRINLQRIRDGKRLRGPKVRAFARALKGDADAIVVDTWVLRAVGYREHELKLSGAIRVAHEAIRLVAEAMGWTGAEAQAAIWVSYRQSQRRADRDRQAGTFFLKV